MIACSATVWAVAKYTSTWGRHLAHADPARGSRPAKPASQGYEFYTALKRRGVPVTMGAYPRMPHVPKEPKQLPDITAGNLEWFDHHLRSKAQ
jgi:hypothetical protein